MKTNARKKAEEWTGSFFDDITRKQVQQLIENNPSEIEEAFYKDLDFGTGGMRGIMGPGTNRINKYTIGKANAGLANYLNEQFTGDISVAIAYDSRNLSDYFAMVSAQVLSAQGIKVYLFKELRPTPELSFAVRQLKCQAGIVVTASHNPKEYNGYKVYWDDGGQLVPPHDKGVIDKVNAIERFDNINFSGNDALIEMIDSVIDIPYSEKVAELINRETPRDNNVSLVYTSLHGSGITMIPKILEKCGFTNLHIVEEQAVPDGNFPTVESPNPEEKTALKMALELAKKIDADLLFGTDPDCDRVGLAVKNKTGKWILLNGNEAGTILINYLLEKTPAEAYSNSFICKTIVTTRLIDKMAAAHKVRCINTLTGFKYIAREIRDREGKLKFIGGGEESFGYLADDFVRDKDAVISSLLFSQIAAITKTKGQTLIDYLNAIYHKYGVYRERLVSLTKKGKKGIEEISDMMENFRKHIPETLAGEKVVKFYDYREGVQKEIQSNTETAIMLDRSNVLQLETEKGSLITVRPSGTEPKIKFYFSVNHPLINDNVEETKRHLEKQLDLLVGAFS